MERERPREIVIRKKVKHGGYFNRVLQKDLKKDISLAILKDQYNLKWDGFQTWV